MGQGDLRQVLELGWQNYQDRQQKFSDYKAKYTAKTATDALKALDAALALPDEQARGAAAERTRGLLLDQRLEFLDVWQQLDGYIEDTFPERISYKAMRDAAGHRDYEAASGNDWTALGDLVSSAKTFVRDHAEKLREVGGMTEAFETLLAEEAKETTDLIKQFRRETLAAQQGTTARETALLACIETFAGLGRDAQRIWRRQPEEARLFEVQYLLGIVRGTGQAGIRGLLTLAGGSPAAGVTVAVRGAIKTPEAAVSDEDGRYALAVPAGSYIVAFGGAGYVAREAAVVVEAGVKKRVDGVMEESSTVKP